MKKLFFIVSIALATTTMFSCSNENQLTDLPINQSCVSTTEDKTIKSLATLNEQIEEYNNCRFETMGQTRGSWSKFWNKLKRIFSADATGAIIATNIDPDFSNSKNIADGYDNIKGVSIGRVIVTAAVASLYELFCKKNDYTHLTPDDGVKIYDDRFGNIEDGKIEIAKNDSSLIKPIVNNTILATQNNYETDKFNLIDSIGYYHNSIIVESANKNNNIEYWKSLTTQELVSEISNSVEDELNLNKGSLQRYTTEISNILEDKQSDNYKEVLRVSNSKLANIINIIESYVDGLADPEDTEECLKYSNVIKGMIDDSDLSDEDKKIIKIGISVAFSSSQLWNIEAIECE